MKLNLSRQVYILISIPLFFELVFVAILMSVQIKLEQSYEREMRAKSIAIETSKVMRLCLEGGAYMVLERTIASDRGRESGSGGDWVLAGKQLAEGQKPAADTKPIEQETTTGGSRERLKGNAKSFLADAYPAWNNVKALIKPDDPTFAIAERLSKILESLRDNFETLGSGQLPDFGQKVLAGQIFYKVRRALPLLDQLIDQQSELQEKEAANQREFRDQIRAVVFAGVVANIAIAIGLALFFNRRTLSRLTVLMANSKRLPDGQELLPMVAEGDEISDLDRMFHRMAKRLNEARRRERTIIANAADVIFTLDLNFKFTLVSDACQRLWGYAPFELEGKSIEAVMEKEEFERVRRELSVLSESEAMKTIECAVRRRGESPVSSMWSVFHSQSEATIFCVAHDITERKELERLRNEFMTMVSHDVRSPLSSLAATYHLLTTGALGELTERGKKLTQGGEKTVERLIALISDLLDLDRLDAGKLALEMREIQSSTLFAETLDSTQAVADKKKIKIEVRDPGIVISCDPDRIVQVLVNLIGNSLKFAPDGSTVFLSLDVVSDWAEFRVTDQGRGIPEEKIDSLFSRYSQVEHTDATNKGGSGLGLAICKSLVEAHRGTIGVESEMGVGSTFWFRIPSNSEAK